MDLTCATYIAFKNTRHSQTITICCLSGLRKANIAITPSLSNETYVRSHSCLTRKSFKTVDILALLWVLRQELCSSKGEWGEMRLPCWVQVWKMLWLDPDYGPGHQNWTLWLNQIPCFVKWTKNKKQIEIEVASHICQGKQKNSAWVRAQAFLFLNSEKLESFSCGSEQTVQYFNIFSSI